MSIQPYFFSFLHNRHYSFYIYIFYRLFFGLLVHPVSHIAIGDPLFNSTPVPSNLLLDLNLNVNLNPETTVHDDINNVKY